MVNVCGHSTVALHSSVFGVSSLAIVWCQSTGRFLYGQVFEVLALLGDLGEAKVRRAG